MYKHISVPVDGTGDSSAAVACAIDLAPQDGGTIELVAVHHFARQQAEVEAARTRVESAGHSATVTVLQGKVADALTDHIAGSGADLVVMTPSSGRIERLLLGSVTSEVVRHGGKPILMLPPPVRDNDVPPRIRHILVTLDGSTFADQILPHAERLAQRVHARITLLTVVQPMIATVATAGESLEARASLLRARGIDVSTDVVLSTSPGRAIVDYVAAKAIDLVAMSTNGRGGLERLVIGSVANQVLHASNAMMLVIRPVAAVIGDVAVTRPASPARPADRVDDAGRESFPASDPPSWSTMISRAPDEKGGVS